MNVRELVTVLKFKTDAQSMKSAENSINKIKGMMAKIKPATLKVNTGNLGNARKSVSALANSVTRLNGRTITVNAKANVGVASKQINALAQKVRSASKTVTVKANTNAIANATKRVHTLQGAVTRLNGRSVNIRTNTGGLTNLQRKVNDIQKKLAILNRARVRAIKVGADTSGIDRAIRKLKELDRMQTRTTQNFFRTKAQNIPKQKNTPNQTGGANMMGGVMGGLKGMFVALGGMAIVNEIKQTADAMMSLSSRIKLVTKDDAERLQVESKLYQMSIKNRASLEDLGDLYYKTASASKQFGASQEDVLRLTDIVSKSLIIGGADTNQQKATILQLSQALGSGVLQGDELRSLRENAPKLMQSIANYLGKNMAELKEMGAKGELTTQVLMESILASGKTIDTEFNRITPTIGQAITVLGNKWSKLILDIQNSTGVFGQIAGLILQGVDLIGKAIDWVVAEFGTATPEMMGMLEDFKNLWKSLQPFISAIGTIFMNLVVPAMKIFGRVASAVLGAVAQLLQPIADILGTIAKLIATISGGLPSILKGFDNMVSKAQSGALQQYRNIMTENNQTNNITVSSPADAGRVMRENNTFFEATAVD